MFFFIFLQCDKIHKQNMYNINKKVMEDLNKRCPYCGEEILAIAIKCRYCHEWLDKKDIIKA